MEYAVLGLGTDGLAGVTVGFGGGGIGQGGGPIHGGRVRADHPPRLGVRGELF